jgi:two-component system cell cycle response regulator DivK
MVLVLIVDDHAECRWLLAEFFQWHGYRTAGAENGAEALRLALADPPDVIVLDLAMPVMCGERFREHQLREPTIAHVPVVCVSGCHDTLRQSATLGLSGFLKPAEPDALLEEVRRLCTVRFD